MTYIKTKLQDDRGNIIYAKDSCKKCQGRGIVGTKKDTGQAIACSCGRILVEGAKE